MSNSKTKTASSSGIGLSSGLFLLFLGLKLGEVGIVAKWSWWWVFSPLWIPVAVILFIIVIVLFVMLLKVVFNHKKTTTRANTFNQIKKSSFQERLEQMAKEKQDKLRNK